MRLVDLDARWVERDGERVGLIYLCPCCRVLRIFTALVPFPSVWAQADLVNRQHPDIDPSNVSFSRRDLAWKVEGGSHFGDLTLSPSIDASAAGHWHGFIRGGAIA